MKDAADLNNPALQALFEKASPINHVTSDDPLVYMFFNQSSAPLPVGCTGQQYIQLLMQKLDSLGIECVMRLREQTNQTPVDEYARFFFKHLTGREQPEDTKLLKQKIEVPKW